MEHIIQLTNRQWYIIVGVFILTVIYYYWFYNYYYKNKKTKYINIFNKKDSDINNFNIFASKEHDILKHDQEKDAKLLEPNNTNNWNQALEELQQYNSQISNESQLQDFLDEQDITFQD